FSDADYARLGTRLLQNPSVKTQADQDALWSALHDGTLNFVATDHAPHTHEEKAQPYPKAPSGMPSIENALALMLDAVNHGRCTLEEIVRWTSAGPAAAWGLAGKGQIAEGFDADLVLVDLDETRTVRDSEQVTKAGWSPWDGVALTGWPVGTLVAGQRVYWCGRFDEAVRGREAVFGR
ncbi:MAG TPA: amidohydrolase family protein, partial [Rhodothermales bacterium]|nr:amidohydrolase family protein [Rhodothermales bacterium]